MTNSTSPTLSQATAFYVKQKRKQLKLTREVLALMLKMHVTQLSRIEHNQSIPSIDFLEKLAEVFDLSPDALFTQIRQVQMFLKNAQKYDLDFFL